MNFAPITFLGAAGFVQVEALAAFAAKAGAVDAARALQLNPPKDAGAALAAADAAFSVIQKANRRIKRGGWHFHTSRLDLTSRGHTIIEAA